MKLGPERTRVLAVLAAAALATACGGGDSGDGAASGDDGSNGGSQTPATPDPSGNVTVSGAVTFDFVPSTSAGLAYAATEERPVRAVTVEARGDDGEVLATTTTDTGGSYALDVPAGRTVSLRVRAEMVRIGTPAWDVRVVDNTGGDALYVLDGAAFDTGDADLTRDLHAPSGWTGTSYGGERSAAPFAILDTVYDAIELVLDADAGRDFPPLVVHWSPNNVPTTSDLPFPDDLEAGEIGSSKYIGGGAGAYRGIYVLGAENSDTDEYDRHVIAHEWGHYFEDQFSRSDSRGGQHAFGDRLDMRTAFGEGFGNAFSGMVTGSSTYRDAAGERQSQGFGFDLEGSSLQENSAPGWFSEQSIQELIWDMFDAAADGADATLAVGFEPIHAILTGPQATTPAQTSVFSFLDAFKRAYPNDAGAVDTLTSTHEIEPVQSAFGEGETNDADTTERNILPIYRRDLAVNGEPAHEVCSTNEFGTESTGAGKLGSRRFLRFTVDAAGEHTITVTTTEMPADAEYADPDFVVHQGAVSRRSASEPTAACKDVSALPGACVEKTTMALSAGEHVLEVYEWTNIGEAEEEYPPIGRTCFDVKVTRP